MPQGQSGKRIQFTNETKASRKRSGLPIRPNTYSVECNIYVTHNMMLTGVDIHGQA